MKRFFQTATVVLALAALLQTIKRATVSRTELNMRQEQLLADGEPSI